jgi:hypothetical protein
MSVSNYTEAAWLSRLKNVSTAAAETHYYSLHTGDPFDTADNEATTFYVAGRASYTATAYTAPENSDTFRVSKNTEAISFGNAIADASLVENISYYGCWDADLGGNLLYSGIFQNAGGIPKLLEFFNGDPVLIDINLLSRLVPFNPLSTFEADTILGFLTGVNFSGLANLYAGLNTSISPDSTGTEVTSSIRGDRLTIAPTFWSEITTLDVSQQIVSISNLDFGSSGNSVTGITALTFWDAENAGNLIGYGSRVSINIESGDPVLVPAGSIIWRIS